MEKIFETRLADLPATQAFAARLAPLLASRDAVLLRGDLGAGKTAFARALLQALGVSGETPSPTFTLVQTYETQAFSVAHFDLYRLKTPEEIEEIGFDEALADGVVLVEWPEKAGAYMPRDALTLFLSVADENGARDLKIGASGTWPERLKELFNAD